MFFEKTHRGYKKRSERSRLHSFSFYKPRLKPPHSKPPPPRGRLIITLFQAIKDRRVEILPVSAWRVRSGNLKHPGAVACGVAHLRPPRGICLLQENSLFACFERGVPARRATPWKIFSYHSLMSNSMSVALVSTTASVGALIAMICGAE